MGQFYIFILFFSPKYICLCLGQMGDRTRRGHWFEQRLALDWPSFPGQTLAEIVSPGVNMFQDSLSCGTAWRLLASLVGISQCPGLLPWLSYPLSSVGFPWPWERLALFLGPFPKELEGRKALDNYLYTQDSSSLSES